MCVCGGGGVFISFMQAKSEGFPVIFPLGLLGRGRGGEGEGGKREGRQVSPFLHLFLFGKERHSIAMGN